MEKRRQRQIHLPNVKKKLTQRNGIAWRSRAQLGSATAKHIYANHGKGTAARVAARQSSARAQPRRAKQRKTTVKFRIVPLS